MALLALLGAGVIAAAPGGAQDSAGGGAKPEGFELSFAPGGRDAAGRFMGGTEIRSLVAHGGKLYAGNGYWEDRPGSEGPQGAQILVLDRPDGEWRVDQTFDDRLPGGRFRDLAIGAMREVVFATDGTGKPLLEPVPVLIASTWDLSGAIRVFARDDATGAWAAVTLTSDRRIPGHLPQVRAFGQHRDRVTGIDHVFAGQDPRGVFSGSYGASAPGRILWSTSPEFDLSTIAASDANAEFSSLGGQARISGFAECDDRLYAAIGQQIYERTDGVEPHWRLVYTNPKPGRSQTGLRGLTAVPDPSGHGEALLAAVEGTQGRIVRVDPKNGGEVTELDLKSFLGEAWGMGVSYTISAYNDMAAINDSRGHELLLIGFEAFIPPSASVAPGHSVVDVDVGRLESGAWYLMRDAEARYTLHRIPALSSLPMIAPRAIIASPFPHDAEALYLGGYDANQTRVHNSAWIVRATLAAALGP
ncbi:MAG: hypothetical protein ACLQJL_16560 [Roseiarcus sp.]